MYRFIFLSFLLPSILYAQKPGKYSAVTQQLAQQVMVTSTTATPARLAVVPFTATHASVENSPQFGEYLTETVIGLLGNHPDKLKLFERTRMDAILKEHEFILSEMMKPAAALKIGQLAPIDILLSGTYTKLKSYIDISARLMDVTSGEVLMTFNGRVKADKNIATLFKGQSTTSIKNQPAQETSGNQTSQHLQVTVNNNTGATASKTDACKAKIAAFQPKLSDLSSSDKIDAVAREAMRTPFDNTCGKLHINVIESFIKFNIQHPQYRSFLLQTLDTIALPTNDDRAYHIIAYFGADDNVSDEEWSTALKAISHAAVTKESIYRYNSIHGYLKPLLKTSRETESIARIDEFFDLVSARKIGLPLPATFEQAFFEAMQAAQDKNGNQVFSRHIYKQYAHRLYTDDKSKHTLFSKLEFLYKEEKDTNEKSIVMDWLIEYINKNEYSAAHDDLYNFISEYERVKKYGKQNEIEKYSESDIKKMISQCESKFSEYALRSNSPVRETRLTFCIENNIAVPGSIPTIQEAEAILKNTDNLDEQLRVLKLLAQMGDKPKSIEPALISTFTQRTLEDKRKLTEIQALAITVLGNTKTTNPEALSYMVNETIVYGGQQAEAARKALLKIGKPSVKPLTERLEKTLQETTGARYGYQKQLITLLGKIGKDALSAKPLIEKVLERSTDKDVQYTAEAALQAMK